MNNIKDGHMRVLYIDAWGNNEDGWEWNSWYVIGDIDKEEFESVNDYKQWFIDGGYVNEKFPLEIKDDGCNVVVCDKETSEPLFAIEYGCHY